MKEEKINGQPTVFIETYGCQMNKGDSEIVAGILSDEGYGLAPSVDEADIVLINTCSVRANAEQRALGRVSTLAGWKREAPHRRLGIIGCMAQRLGEALVQDSPHVDLVVGPDAYRQLPELLRAQGVPGIAVDFDGDEHYSGIAARRQNAVNAWVTIMRGCNNFCAYCIVPYTRGRERSREADAVVQEVRDLVKVGFREVTLLGQNVNSYHDGETDFPALLRHVARETDILRVRYMTSHPKDLSPALLDVMAGDSKICEHVHLPLQAGSDAVLKTMNRRYTQAHYLGLIEAIRERMPQAGITTDIMVGFPSESEADFQETLKVVEAVGFDDAFTYYFSPREGTAAATMPGQVDKAVRLERLDRLIRLQRRITAQKKQTLIGRVEEVLPEATSKQSQNDWLGRTGSDHTVVFPKGDLPWGEPVRVRIVKVEGSTLIGQPEN